MGYLETLTEFESVRNEIGDLLATCNLADWEVIKFGEWTLREIVGHLSGWDKYDVESLKCLLAGVEPDWGGEVDEFNLKSVDERKNWSWEKIYEEFVIVGLELFRMSRELPPEYWEKKFWKAREYTPRMMLEIDLEHYRDEHLAEFREKLGSLG